MEAVFGSEIGWDMLGHGFNVVYLMAFMARNDHHMRRLLMLAAALELFYFLNVATTPLWSGVFWSAAYLVFNGSLLLRGYFRNGAWRHV